jgi:XTP/dITP diphosphohydrolase
MNLIFATNNLHKIKEISAVLPEHIKIITLKEAGINIDIPEPYNSLEKNATQKSQTIYSLTGTNCFSEDTGLEVKALNGEPGVKSARYAGPDKSFNANIEKLLSKLSGVTDRTARFRTVISLIIDGKETLFQGVCEGTIALAMRGTEGFGYDPVFIPDGAGKTFAEMKFSEKSVYSHRTRAIEKLVGFLNKMKINS